MPYVIDGIIGDVVGRGRPNQDIERARGGLRLPASTGVRMLDAGKALTEVKTEDLIALLRDIHREPFEGGFATPVLTRGRLLYLQDAVGFLHGLDDRTVRAVLVAVIAERMARTRR